MNIIEEIYDKKFLNFPYYVYTNNVDVFELFKNLKEYEPIILNDKFVFRGFYPDNRQKYLPPKFQNMFVLIDSIVDYSKLDCLTDVFMQPLRFTTKKNYHDKSPFDFWLEKYNSEFSLDLPKEEINKIYFEYKEFIGTQGLTVPSLFRLSWAKGLLTVLSPYVNKSPKLLDFSAGWGDRLLATIAMGWGYTGYDPNKNLIKPHNKIIELFGNPKRHVVHYEPFEEAELTETYDIVFTSPPFFDLEIYNTDETQSIIKFPKFEQWLTGFLLKSVIKAFNALNKNGIMCIYIADYRTKNKEKRNMCEFILNKLEDIKNCEYLGIIGFRRNRGTNGCFVWRKV